MLRKEIQCQCSHRNGVGCRSDYHENTRSANAPNDIKKISSVIELHFARALDNLIKSALKLSIKVLHYSILYIGLKIFCERLCEKKKILNSV